MDLMATVREELLKERARVMERLEKVDQVLALVEDLATKLAPAPPTPSTTSGRQVVARARPLRARAAMDDGTVLTAVRAGAATPLAVMERTALTRGRVLKALTRLLAAGTVRKQGRARAVAYLAT